MHRPTIQRLTAVVSLLFASVMLTGAGKVPRGLSPDAEAELEASGVFKYVDAFDPIVDEDVGEGWTKHTFNPDGGNGPICIAGTPFSAFTKKGNPAKLLIMLQGGGACWQNFYFCNIFAEAQEPPPDPVGIWGEEFAGEGPNPIDDWSIVYMPYCDGSVFSGDNDVLDPIFPLGGVRYHRGLRNVTAGIDLAK
ncbi:MAG: hypothetical protein ACWGPN_01600, partial [Gammaproteobacteria bacterium]